MSLKDRINDDLKTALLSGDHLKCDVLRGLKAVILNEEVAKNKRDSGLEDESIEKIIASEIKKRHDSASIYESANRNELAQQERTEANILMNYLPKQLSESEVISLVNEIISSQKADNNNLSMGQIIGLVKQKVGNQADGALVARLVKDALQ